MNFSIRRIRRKAGAKESGVVDVADELARKGKWLAWISQSTGQGKRVRLYYRPKPLLILFASVTVAGYLAVAVALTWWLNRVPFNRVGFFDVAMPWRWTGMNALRGEGFADRGVEELADAQFQRGIFYIGRGLSLQPNNPAARLALAEFYAKGNYYDGVSRTVKPQFAYGYSPELAKLLLQQAGAADDSDAVLAFVEEWRDRPELAAEDREVLIEWEYRTLMHLKQLEAALAALNRVSGESDRWTVMRVSALAKLGRFDEALALARGIRAEIPGMFPLARRTLASVLSQQGDRDALKRVLDGLIDEGNLAPEAWVFGVEQMALAQFNAESADYLGGFFRRFGAQPDAVNGLLTRLLGTRNSFMVQAAAALAKDWQAVTAQNRVGMGMLYLSENRWDLLRADWPPGAKVEPEIEVFERLFQGVLQAIGPDAADEALRAVIDGGRFGLVIYRELALGMAKAERWDLVKVMADAGTRQYPHSRFLREYRSRAEEKLQAVEPDKRLSRAVEEMGRQYQEGDIPALKFELKNQVEAENWDEVESIVRRVRRQRPAWLNQVEAALDDGDARAGAAKGDLSRLIRLAPAMLRRDGTLAAWFTDQAERAIAIGEKIQAKALLEAVLAEEKFYHRARAMLKALTAGPPETKPEPESTTAADVVPET